MKDMKDENVRWLSHEREERIKWCAKVVRNLGLGDVLMDIDWEEPRFCIRKGGMVTHRFRSLELFEKFAEETFMRKKTFRPMKVRSVPNRLYPAYAC